MRLPTHLKVGRFATSYPRVWRLVSNPKSRRRWPLEENGRDEEEAASGLADGPGGGGAAQARGSLSAAIDLRQPWQLFAFWMAKGI